MTLRAAIWCVQCLSFLTLSCASLSSLTMASFVCLRWKGGWFLSIFRIVMDPDFLAVSPIGLSSSHLGSPLLSIPGSVTGAGGPQSRLILPSVPRLECCLIPLPCRSFRISVFIFSSVWVFTGFPGCSCGGAKAAFASAWAANALKKFILSLTSFHFTFRATSLYLFAAAGFCWRVLAWFSFCFNCFLSSTFFQVASLNHSFVFSAGLPRIS